MAESSRLDKAQGLKRKKKKEKVSSKLEKEIKLLRANSSGLDKAQDLKRKNARNASSRLKK